MRKLRRVALLIEPTHEYGRGLLRGIARYMRAHEYWRADLVALRESSWADVSRRRGQYDGIVFRSTGGGLREQLPEGVPGVDVSAWFVNDTYPAVMTDDRAVGAMAAEYFMDLGHKEFAFFAVEPRHDAEERLQGFTEKLVNSGHRVHQRVLPAHGAGTVDSEDMARRLVGWLGDLPKPVGLLGFNDHSARVVAEACQQAGILVPEEVAIVGVDNDALICEFAATPLSSVEQNSERIGFQAADILARMMAGKRVSRKTTLVPPSRVVVRRSSDVLAIEDASVAQAVRFIRDHADEGLRVEDVLDHLEVSRRSLELRFRKTLSRTPAEEIRRARVERAKVMLTETELRIGQISDRLAFGNPKVFVTVFRRETGMTPSEYRRQYR